MLTTKDLASLIIVSHHTSRHKQLTKQVKVHL